MYLWFADSLLQFCVPYFPFPSFDQFWFRWLLKYEQILLWSVSTLKFPQKYKSKLIDSLIYFFFIFKFCFLLKMIIAASYFYANGICCLYSSLFSFNAPVNFHYQKHFIKQFNFFLSISSGPLPFMIELKLVKRCWFTSLMLACVTFVNPFTAEII